MELRAGYKQTEVGVIPEDWRIFRLHELAELTSSKRIFENDYVQTGIPFYRGKEISQLIEGVDIDDVCYITEARYSAIKTQFGAPVEGDILITAVGTLANVYVVDTDSPFYFKDGNLIWLRNIKGVSPLFLGIQLRRAKSAILNGAIGSSQKALTIVVLKELLIALPSTIEQRAIATALSDVDALLAAQDKLIAKKRDIKQAAMQQLLTGKQRLPGFGGDWEVKRLHDVAELSPGINKPLSEMGSGVLYVTVQDLYNGTSIRVERLGRIRVSAEELQIQALAIGDIIFGKSSVKRDGIGYPSIFLGSSEPAVCTGFAYRARATPSQADAKFLFYALRWEPTRRWLIDNAQSSALTNINKSIADAIPINLPPLAEQTAIATILSDMDAEIAALEQQRDKTRALKQGMMQELLTGRIRLI